MSFNGSGTFVVNTAGQPVVPNTVISATAFNALTADLANGLSTCITKDGQTTPTANIPMGNNKITGLAPGTSGTDAANLSQVQGSTAKLLQSVTGTDTITAAMVPALTAYAAGQMFYFVAAGDNTGAVTINIDSLGAKSVTRDGSTALVAGDITNGKVVVIVYDGTRFQLLNSNAFTNLYVSGNLGVGNNTPAYKFHVERPSYGITGYFYANDGTRNPRLVVYGSSSGTTIQHTFSTGADSLIFAVGGAIGTGTEVARFLDGGNFGIGTSSPGYRLDVVDTGGNALRFGTSTVQMGGFVSAGLPYLGTISNHSLALMTNSVERMRITNAGNIVAGASAALATTATDGFLYVPTCAGTPTGVPTAITGMAPIVVNTTNNKLYFYSGGSWRDAGP